MPGQTIPRFHGAFVADASAVNTGAIQPDHQGVKIFNNTGSDLPPGTLVYRSGWNAANALPQVSLSDNHTAGAHAHYVVGATTIKAGTVGLVFKHWFSTPTMNTGGSTIGNPVYLDSSLGGGPGTWTLTANSGPNNRLEVVGHVVVVDAVVGQIDFDVQTHKFSKCGAIELQPLTVGTGTLALGAVTPDTQGLTVWNATGLTLTVGQLVYVSGYNAANSMPQVSLAANNVANAAATFVVAIACLNGASTLVRKHYLSTATLNVTGSVGDPVYLDSTAGGWTQVPPAAPTSRQQIIGHVVAVSASVGQIDFDVVSSGGTVISRSDIQPGDVTPDDSGITAWNATGSTITAGQLVYVSGYNAANSMDQVSLAVNNTANTGATYVAVGSTPNGASGVFRRHWLSTANLVTTGFTVGDAIYLSNVAGGWTHTAPSGGGNKVQVVGRVVVVDAAVGQIDFDVESNTGDVIGNAQFQAQCVGTAAIANAAVGSAQATATLLQTLTLTITNAQLKALRATPITIIAAPGAGNWIEFCGGNLLFKAGANVVTVGGNLGLRYQDGSSAKVSEDVNATGFLDQATDQFTQIRPRLDFQAATAVVVNKPIVLHNIGAGEETGNAAADATLIVKVSYRIWGNT